MNEYFISIIIMAAACQLVMIVTPDKDPDTYKKPIRFLCGMVMLCTISAPIQQIVAGIQGGFPDISQILPEENAVHDKENPEMLEENMWEIALQKTADDWIGYLGNQYDIAAESVNIVFVTDDEKYEIQQIQVFLEKCPYTARKNIENDLRTKMEPIPVYVFGE